MRIAPTAINDEGLLRDRPAATEQFAARSFLKMPVSDLWDRKSSEIDLSGFAPLRDRIFGAIAHRATLVAQLTLLSNNSNA